MSCRHKGLCWIDIYVQVDTTVEAVTAAETTNKTTLTRTFCCIQFARYAIKLIYILLIVSALKRSHPSPVLKVHIYYKIILIRKKLFRLLIIFFFTIETLF